jgi:magnesium-transporting ATPase (P-type)
MIKGAPERILDLCDEYYDLNKKLIKIDSSFIQRFNLTYKKLAS